MIVLGSGTRFQRLAVTARRVSAVLMRFSPVSLERLLRVPGIGHASATRIIAALALAARVRHQLPLDQPWHAYPAKGIPYCVKVSVFSPDREEVGSVVYQDASLERLLVKIGQYVRSSVEVEGAS